MFITSTVNDVVDSIDAISRNEYLFVRACERFFSYHESHEILLSSPDETKEIVYYVPILKTLQSLLRNQRLITLLLDNIAQQLRLAQMDDDRLFSVRNRKGGHHIDENALLLQLYVDDIGTTNPIAPKKDQQKMTLLSFVLDHCVHCWARKKRFFLLLMLFSRCISRP